MTQSPRFRYEGLTRWWKGNLHVHSTRSDGGKTPAELAVLYAGEGYDFIVLADHWVAGAPDDLPRPSPLAVLDGVELDGDDSTGANFHVVCIGCRGPFDRAMGLEAAMTEARRQGAVLVLAHPLWTGNSAEDALRHGFDGVEAWNNVAVWLNGKGSGAFHWDRMLDRSPSAIGPAVDDAHITIEHPLWNGGWIHVDASVPTPAVLLAAIRAGRFVSSRGPVIRFLAARGREVTVSCSPVRFIRLVGPSHHGRRLAALDGPSLTEGVFTVPDDWAHARIEIEDESGRRAWTNALFA
ncbi:MAG: hypothetical protein NTU62_09615 [Spirochaetes bacterium]|nr:hypothetical protein [Spirochaetota bacterium]